MRWATPTATASSTATSSRRTSCWKAGTRWWPTSAWGCSFGLLQPTRTTAQQHRAKRRTGPSVVEEYVMGRSLGESGGQLTIASGGGRKCVRGWIAPSPDHALASRILHPRLLQDLAVR